MSLELIQIVEKTIFEVLTVDLALELPSRFRTLKLDRDIGLVGDDVDDFLEYLEERLGQEIHIDLSEHFSGEGLFARRPANDLSVSELATKLVENGVTPVSTKLM